ncbi:HMA domain-containing protein, partial [Dysosmobacter welbionis]
GDAQRRRGGGGSLRRGPGAAAAAGGCAVRRHVRPTVYHCRDERARPVTEAESKRAPQASACGAFIYTNMVSL